MQVTGHIHHCIAGTSWDSADLIVALLWAAELAICWPCRWLDQDCAAGLPYCCSHILKHVSYARSVSREKLQAPLHGLMLEVQMMVISAANGFGKLSNLSTRQHALKTTFITRAACCETLPSHFVCVQM